MAYDDYELSVDASQPDELFRFYYDGDGSTYTITSSAYSIDFQGSTYEPIPVKRSGIKRTAETGKNSMTVQMGRNNEHFARYLAGSLTYRTDLEIFTLQPDGSFIKCWSGVVKSVNRKAKVMEVIATPISSSASRPVLHRKYQVQCPHALYSYYCKVDKPTYTRAGTLTSVAGDTLTASIFGTEVSGWFAGGTITIGSEKKTIVSHTGTTITLLDHFYDAATGDSFSASAGCSHSEEACDSKFSNMVNYGGCPWIPSDDDITNGKSFTY